MKNFFAVISLMIFSVSAFAFKEKDTNVQAGIGIFGTRGIVGVSGERFFSPNHALSLAVGIDYIGGVSSVGYKYFTEKKNTSESIWSKCFLLFECDAHNYFGGGLQYAGATTTKFTESNGQERTYATGHKWLSIATVGSREVYKSGFTLDYEITYRNIIAGGESVQTSGLPENDVKSLERGFRNVGFGLAAGYLF